MLWGPTGEVDSSGTFFKCPGVYLGGPDCGGLICTATDIMYSPDTQPRSPLSHLNEIINAQDGDCSLRREAQLLHLGHGGLHDTRGHVVHHLRGQGEGRVWSMRVRAQHSSGT